MYFFSIKIYQKNKVGDVCDKGMVVVTLNIYIYFFMINIGGWGIGERGLF